jgi:hypothetical protein
MKLITLVAFVILGVFGVENASAQLCTGKLNVCNLDSSNPPTPDQKYPKYNAPVCLPSPVDPNEQKKLADAKKLLEDACNLAPASVQQDILTVTRIHIVQNPNGLPDDWGYWESKRKRAPTDPTSGSSYIGLLAKGITDQDKLSTQEQNLMKKLVLSMTNNDILKDAVTVTVKPVGSDSQELAVLARMAHEVAHIKYYKQRVDKTSCFFDPANGKSKFMDVSWDQTHLTKWRGEYFTDFGKDATTRHLQVTNIPHLDNTITTTTEVYNVVRDGSFVSLFASVRPDEDFVETYKFFALKNKVTDYVIEFGSGTSMAKAAIIENNKWKGAGVRDKVNCVQGLPHM